MDDWIAIRSVTGTVGLRLVGEIGEATVSVFGFNATDVVLVGEGACAEAARRDIERAGCLQLLLSRAVEGASSPKNAMHFHTQWDPFCTELLGRAQGGRVFMVGAPPRDIFDQVGSHPVPRLPEITDISAIMRAQHAPIGLLQSRRLELACRTLGLVPARLGPEPRFEWGVINEEMPDVGLRMSFLQWLEEAELCEEDERSRKIDPRPQPDGICSERRDTALWPYLTDDGLVLLRSRSASMFDAAFVDEQLLTAFASASNASVFLLGPDVWVLDPARLASVCERLDVGVVEMGLNL